MVSTSTKSSERKKKKKKKSASKPPHIVIIGAGLAGLCAAYELEKRGCTQTILEAESKHIGGRVRTLPFGRGQYGEVGAMRIPQSHDLVLSYTKEFGLELRRFINTHPDAYYFVRGRKEHRPGLEGIRQLFQLRPWEHHRTPLELWQHAVTRQLSTLTDTEKDDLDSSKIWKTRKIHDFDHLSLHQLLEMNGLSPEAIEFLASTWGLETLLESASTEHLREELQEVWSREFFEIVGGMGRLPEAFHRRLRTKPKSGCEVIRLEPITGTDRAAAVYTDGTDEHREEGDFVVCTIPFSVLQTLEVSPPFCTEKQRAIREITYESATKVLVQTRRRFWETDDAIFGGASYSDLLTGVTHYPSDNHSNTDESVSRGPGVLLASYSWGEAARRLGSLPDPTRCRLAIDLVSKFHPQLKDPNMIIGKPLSWTWHDYRWSLGAFAFYLPGQFARLHRHVVSPEGRIHFAGEHTSLSHTWMQGALESGRRAATEILSRAGLA